MEDGMIEVYFRPNLISACFGCPDGPNIYNAGEKYEDYEDSDNMNHIKEQFLAQMMGWA
jgi:hypothetical protein